MRDASARGNVQTLRQLQRRIAPDADADTTHE